MPSFKELLVRFLMGVLWLAVRIQYYPLLKMMGYTRYEVRATEARSTRWLSSASSWPLQLTFICRHMPSMQSNMSWLSQLAWHPHACSI